MDINTLYDPARIRVTDGLAAGTRMAISTLRNADAHTVPKGVNPLRLLFFDFKTCSCGMWLALCTRMLPYYL